MTAPRVLFAHERPAIQRAVELVLAVEGFAVESVADGDTVADRLRRGPIGKPSAPWDGVVLDVGLAGPPAYELVPAAKQLGARCVVLVASIYSRTSYKRRPTQLYGADDYVEIHHLGDHLPMRLRHHLGLPQQEARAGDMIRDALEAEGDSRLTPHPAERLAALIVSDVVLYNGDAAARASDANELWRILDADIAGARVLFRDVRRRGGIEDDERDFIAEAFQAIAGGIAAGQPSLLAHTQTTAAGPSTLGGGQLDQQDQQDHPEPLAEPEPEHGAGA
jgi:DNA-binding response OmpR family regulator